MVLLVVSCLLLGWGLGVLTVWTLQRRYDVRSMDAVVDRLSPTRTEASVPTELHTNQGSTVRLMEPGHFHDDLEMRWPE